MVPGYSPQAGVDYNVQPAPQMEGHGKLKKDKDKSKKNKGKKKDKDRSKKDYLQSQPGYRQCSIQKAIAIPEAPVSFHVQPFSEYARDHRKLTFVKKLGEGGFATVKECHDREGQHFAVKIISKLRNKSDEKSFLGEAESMAKLLHPCIVQLVGYFMLTDKSEASITMELVEGGTLQDLLEKMRRNETTVSDAQKKIIAVGIAMGMRCVHKIGLIHRDLKPSNILLTERLEPKIADFGLGRVAEHTMTGAISTPRYMAPDMGQKQYTNAVDVYSFSMILYELYTLQVPFEEINAAMIPGLAMMGQRPEIPDDCPMKRLIEECWAQDPSVRPTFEAIAKRLVEGEESAEVRAFVEKVARGEKAVGVFE